MKVQAEKTIGVKWCGKLCHEIGMQRKTTHGSYEVGKQIMVTAAKCQEDCQGLRMSSTASSTEHYIFDYFGPNIQLFDRVRLS